MRRIIAAIALILVSLALVSSVATAQVDEEALEEVATAEEVAEPDTDDGTIDEAVEDAEETLSEVSPLETWELLSALIIPIIVGGIKQQGFTVQQTNGALFAVSLAFTAVGLYFQGDLNEVEDWITTAMQLILASYAMYQTIFQMLPIPQILEAKTGGQPIEEQRYRRRVV